MMSDNTASLDTLSEGIAALAALSCAADIEAAHASADELLLRMIDDLAGKAIGKLVRAAFRNVPKEYA